MPCNKSDLSLKRLVMYVFIMCLLVIPNLVFGEAVAKFHGSEKSMILEHHARTSKACPNRAAAGLPKSAGEKVRSQDALKGRIYAPKSFAIGSGGNSTHSIKPQEYLNHRIRPSDKRYDSFLMALKLLHQFNAKVLVETGTARNGDQNFAGDGGSTIIFGNWAAINQSVLFTVDISPDGLENAKKATQRYSQSIHFVCNDSIAFLDSFNQYIDFIYLDSFDFDSNNPKPSQEHHLREIIAAYPHLHERSIVMIDDCDLPHGGKGKLVIEFLLSRGWKILYKGYQTILAQ